MTTFTRASLKKQDEQTKIDNLRVVVHKIYLAENLIRARF